MAPCRDRQRRHSRLAVGVAWLLAAGTAGCAHLSARERLAPVRRLIQDRLDSGGATSLAVAVARGERILWEEGFGWSDREKEVPAGPHTMYSLASVSKPFTATGLMRLVEQGRVGLDDPATLHLGETGPRVRVGSAREVTLRRLASHTAGLPLHHHFFPVDGPDVRPPIEVTLRRYANVVFPPGEGLQYSNLGYAVLERVIERVSGQSFAGFMHREVLGPLRLEHTAVVLDPSRHPDLAVRYRHDGRPLPFYDSDHRGASAFYSCVHDLVRFGMFHLEAELEVDVPVLSGRSRRQMRRASDRNAGGYAVGWRVSEHPSGHQLVEHGGDMPGASAVLALVPEARLAVAVLANTSNGVARRVRDEVLDALLPVAWRGSGVARFTGSPREGEKRGRSSPPRWAWGRWSGRVDTHVEGVAFCLNVETDTIRARLGAEAQTAVEAARFRGAWLEGVLAGEIDAPDLRRRPHRLHLKLRRHDDRLQGAITAISLPGAQPPLALSFWIDLRKESPSRRH